MHLVRDRNSKQTVNIRYTFIVWFDWTTNQSLECFLFVCPRRDRRQWCVFIMCAAFLIGVALQTFFWFIRTLNSHSDKITYLCVWVWFMQVTWCLHTHIHFCIFILFRARSISNAMRWTNIVLPILAWGR